MMRKADNRFGYAKREGFTAVSLPYAGDNLQFLVLLPDDVNGLHALESKLTADMLAGCANLERSEEHTSELQSQSNLVCRLLLEKKKQNTYIALSCAYIDGCRNQVASMLARAYFSICRVATGRSTLGLSRM